MTRLVSRAESFETIEKALNQINFSSFDFYSIKESLIDYVKLQYPENFNNYIESDEFISILEIFAYVTELYTYRLDINASENFLSTAKRKQSVLKIAKFLSYSASRNIPGRGLVKIQSIKTTENLFDIDGINLSNKTILWNDVNNLKWKDRFHQIINRILKQDFGSVFPDERKQIDDVLFESYELNNVPIINGVISYSTNVSGQQISLELVPVQLTDNGPIERRPYNNSSFSILYGSDGLGDSSDMTGFFMFTKQGQLQVQREEFDGVTPNQTLEINIDNINDTDIWINNIDSNTNELIVTNSTNGEWEEVDISHAQNIIFNTNPNRNKYEVETLENDNVRIIFGDGEFADIPNGSFDIWFRTSINQNITIPKNTISNNIASFNYIGLDGNIETITFTYSLINSIQNGSESEDIEHIRKIAPAVYYTQDRMVNAKDYNSFMLQDITILKLRSINRTFIGDSKYITWHDPKHSYENVKLFGDDLAIYYKTKESTKEILNESSASQIVYNHVQPLLSSNDFFTLLTSNGIASNDIRKSFTEFEINLIINTLEQAILNSPATLQLFYSIELDEWTILEEISDNTFDTNLNFSNPLFDTSQVLFDMITPWDGIELIAEGLIKISVSAYDWEIKHKAQRIIAQSPESRFWNSNDSNSIYSFDTLLSNQDKIIILDANKNANRNDLLNKNHHYNIIGQELVEPNIPITGLPDIHQLSILPIDENDDVVPDNMNLPNIINPSYQLQIGENKQLPFLTLFQDITVNGLVEYYYNGILIPSPIDNNIIDEIKNIDTNIIQFSIIEYVYFQREEIQDSVNNEWTWLPKILNYDVLFNYITDIPNTINQWKREIGRYPLNFLWMHYTPRYNLIDPAATNIIDTYIMTRQYYLSMLEWLSNRIDIKPDEPSSLELRSNYNYLIESKMISDTLILHTGKFKILFGSKSIEQLQAKFNVIRKTTSRLTNNQIKSKIIGIINTFFDINEWNFGETFYMTELASKIHIEMIEDIKSIVLVPIYSNNLFGDLFIVNAKEDEIFIPHVTLQDISIVDTYTSENIKQELR